ncbi:acyltransferase family protein [Nocardioides sp. zg-DK7169]|uniref:acyltransferase family protein n=1 Tax=Nocardioides sp. zg-DK7169 TaxID=2736600 RepID=UPI001553730A|nr:acyltransferase family protein [Nocardioides sp. zg-DK7169]NPC96854.1 acyltransferase [Nocardioides sp. zg-DK7169]
MTVTAKRLDIQGLRAVAVGLVVAGHVFGHPVGGFVGVDVFFVISGFLITGLLLREVEEHGRISLGGFYRRRARRILPVALLSLAATVTASYVVLLQDRFERTAADAGWAAGFVANWRFAASDADYFSSALPPSPLQHYWSLGVEEQFYVAWPLVLLGLVALARRARHGRGVDVRTAVAVLAAVVVAASFAWAWVQSGQEPTLSYYSTLTRAWEVAAGALLAALAPRLTSILGPARNVLGGLGLAAIVAGALLLDGGSAFPAPLAVLPVLGAVLVLASGIGTGSSAGTGSPRVAATALLRTRPLVHLGALSFSIYLWHWPVLVLGDVLVAERTLTYQVAVLALTLALATASYRLVERPVLDSDFLRPDRDGASRAGRRVALAAVGVGVVLLAVALVVPRDAPGTPSHVATAPGSAPGEEGQQAAGRTPRQAAEDKVAGALVAGLTAEEFPALQPPLDDVVEGGINPELEPGAECLNPSSLTDPDLCWHGTGPRRAMVVGDSVAIAWMPAVMKALGPDWSVRGYGLSNCPYVDATIEIDYDPEGAARCNEARSTIHEQVRAERPDLLVLSTFEAGVLWLGESPLPRAHDAWRDAAVRAIDKMAGEGTQVAIMAPPPAGHAVEGCVSRFSVPRDCQGSPSDAWTAQAAADRAAARRTGATYVDTSSWFCLEDQCPIFAGDTVVRWDIVHVTRQYADSLGDVLRFALRPALRAVARPPATPDASVGGR